MKLLFLTKSAILLATVCFTQIAAAQSFNPETKKLPEGLKYRIYFGSQISFVDIDGDGDLDKFGEGEVFATVGKLSLQLNSGTASQPLFDKSVIDPYELGKCINPTFADIDGDDDFDIIVFNFIGIDKKQCQISINSGSTSVPKFEAFKPFECGIDDNLISAFFVDIDGDGDLDMFGPVKVYDGEKYKGNRIAFQENIGTPQEPEFARAEFAVFGLADLIYSGVDAQTQYFTFADIDNDGDFDVCYRGLYTNSEGKNDRGYVFQYNTGDKSTPSFSKPVVSTVGNDNFFNTPLTFVDLDGDGDMDVIGYNDNKYCWWENWTIK
ncbi:MAG: hypothetical protein A2W93_13840 [Bacteroidetes bacterium GWF2_43_63]|nr:MAG: hypothetical protein A2W94_04035 [Bacteroidetes bacterium GWE2_42_42]OFY55070.1 MAG: hypothetical protein A2W93_13840 [Bacteroidetes bacterium GWF2_43_63]HBG69607.1 hypothetical protein [Bacteroidales bacterium]HCB60654.1 hypothetical protein [Bacteroidales bacterium]HCY24042.1 hypothetical protein [Bacteroidales bacterium]